MKKFNEFYYVSRNGMKLFESVPDARKNTETKRDCLQRALNMSRYYPDAARYWQDMLNETKPILDSKRFDRECQEWGLNPEIVAQHLVVEGKSAVNRVLKDGLIAGFGEDAKFFVDPLYNLVIKPMNKKQEVDNE